MQLTKGDAKPWQSLQLPLAHVLAQPSPAMLQAAGAAEPDICVRNLVVSAASAAAAYLHEFA